MRAEVYPAVVLATSAVNTARACCAARSPRLAAWMMASTLASVRAMPAIPDRRWSRFLPSAMLCPWASRKQHDLRVEVAGSAA